MSNKAPAPTLSELAIIAATLASGRDRTPEQLASEALAVWFSCAAELAEAVARAAQPEPAPNKPLFETPGNFPVVLEDALGFWLPSVKPVDRMPIYRRMLDVWDPNARQNKTAYAPLEDLYQFVMVGRSLILHWESEKSAKRQSAGSKGGSAKAQSVKRKARKRLHR
jgi:hypothetical protein